MLRCYVSPRQQDWDLLLPCAEFALNSTPSTATGYSPAYVLYGREPNLPLEAAVRSVTDCKVHSVVDRIARMHAVDTNVRHMLNRTAAAMVRSANRRRREGDV